MKKILYNANIVTEDQVVHGSLVLDGELIQEVIPSSQSEETVSGENTVDLKGAFILPGLIDIHSDMIEMLVQPRSTAFMEIGAALESAERELAACGITTIFHSIAMYRSGSWDAKECRKADCVRKLAEEIKKIQNRPHMIHNRFHLRYELDNLECYDQALKMMEEGCVNLLSVMDHRPGQGQYKDLNIYRRHLPADQRSISEAEFQKLLEIERTKPMVEGEAYDRLLKEAARLSIPVASHDDDTPEKIRKNKADGILISEFPITMETAKEAAQAGLYAMAGAPNILLGKSHSGNLRAEDAIREGCISILCSDYYPQALLRAVFYLKNKGILTLPAACRLVSLNPAKAVGISEDTGSITPGKRADFLVISEEQERPYLKSVFTSGNYVMKNEYYRKGRDRQWESF
ncbi:phosphonate metabolism protein PhnM [uncultured Roseburia sp.]|uniref:Alpha-D-ribose 1-methylphosphonate 5-triphosphate diphosphatase n=1 Tax=Brotonthovivens ammoniilytica TaxID=2981725 RepID=A0ABT2TGW2_9FIRM|nr:alpha-D-ribose 1-methylphosphonate 5-triphosphate diphosphatase [Brotonthovivens ammoniilytica]MCU6761420.1 alpha-D-ribose 1-methylphosphonate 5-triphosphate diphosphatase [Brotonthovivens ammoniilytica]SCI27923.1 phosphonate metabolism protein PhnM [uncultured Roseburia sp.]